MVLEVGVGAAGKGLVGGERWQSGSVNAGEGAPAVLSMGLRGPEHHLATRKTMERSICAMQGGGGCSTASSSSPEQWRTAEGENRLARDGEALGSIYRGGGFVAKVWSC